MAIKVSDIHLFFSDSEGCSLHDVVIRIQKPLAFCMSNSASHAQEDYGGYKGAIALKRITRVLVNSSFSQRKDRPCDHHRATGEETL